MAITLRPATIVFSAIVLIGMGIGAAVVLLPRRAALPPAAPTVTDAAPPAPAPSPQAPVEVHLTPEAITRAGIETAPVGRREVRAALRLPATVRPDAYTQLIVTPLVGGRVVNVHVAEGDRVSEGQPLATLFSPDLAMAEAAYLGHLAALEADHPRLDRLTKLVAIGASSQQELDDANAQHQMHTSDMEGARQRLRLFGLSAATIDALKTADQITSEAVVRAPSAGVITARRTNQGQVVTIESPMFEVSDRTRVWVIASAYEADLGALRPGVHARVTSRTGARVSTDAVVTYLDPEVDPVTRATRVRFEVSHPSDALRFGELVEVELQAAARGPARALVVPAASVQAVGARQVVYVLDPARAGVFVERTVEPGATMADVTEIRAGLADGDVVVSRGAAFVRAERLRVTPLGR